MSRTITERIKDSEWWLEQAAHGWIGIGAALTSCVVYGIWQSPLAAFWVSVASSAAIAITRESFQNIGDEDNNIPDAIADALFTWFGGLIYSIPWALVTWVK